MEMKRELVPFDTFLCHVFPHDFHQEREKGRSEPKGNNISHEKWKLSSF
jgi:hypothetical protein